MNKEFLTIILKRWPCPWPGRRVFRVWACLLLPLIVVAAPGPVKAQVLGPLLGKGRFELGARYRQVHRDSETKGEFNKDSGSIIFRTGLSRTATLSGELLVGNSRVVKSGGNGRFYLVGAGLQNEVWTRGSMGVTAGFHATRMVYLSKDYRYCDTEYLTLTWVVLWEWSCRIKDQELTLLIGPSYLYDRGHTYAGEPCRESTYESLDNLGFIYGINALLFDHYQGFAYLVYAGYAQPHLGLSYRF